MANVEELTVEVKALERRVVNQEKLSVVSILIAAVSAIAALITTCATQKSAESAKNSAESAKKSVEIELEIHDGLIKNINFEFQVRGGVLRACPLSNNYYRLDTVEITPKLSISGNRSDGATIPYSLTRSGTEKGSLGLYCYETDDIINKVCENIENSEESITECANTMTGMLIHYDVYSTRKTEYAEVQ